MNSISEWMLGKVESVWLWVSYHFLGIFLSEQSSESDSWVGDEMLRVGQYLWHLDSDSCGRRARLSPGIIIVARWSVWPLIGQLDQYPAAYWSVTSLSVLVIFW